MDPLTILHAMKPCHICSNAIVMTVKKFSSLRSTQFLQPFFNLACSYEPPQAVENVMNMKREVSAYRRDSTESQWYTKQFQKLLFVQ